ncbi:MAG: NUDIX domain-containing protein [Gammaproteobacteria bacterium]|nr:NUDIX domain-containing protein [Gammaproteobacteria bacterium]
MAKLPAAGGVVFDDAGRVLLVEPRGRYSGYVWTFPKGRPDDGESHATAAVREVREESGVTARIVESEAGVQVCVGVYEGDLTQTRYYLMQMVATGAPFDAEIQLICWATPAEAVQLIQQTTNPLGRARDAQVLRDALAWRSLV